MKTYQQRIKDYVEKHKIGPLFEDLMSKLIIDLPTEPIPFLIRLLQVKLQMTMPQTVMSMSSVRRPGDYAVRCLSASKPKTPPKTPVSSPSQMQSREHLPKSAGARRTPPNVSFINTGRIKSATTTSSSKSSTVDTDCSVKKKASDEIVENAPSPRPQLQTRPVTSRRSTFPLTKDRDLSPSRSANFTGPCPVYNRYYRSHSSPESGTLTGIRELTENTRQTSSAPPILNGIQDNDDKPPIQDEAGEVKGFAEDLLDEGVKPRPGVRAHYNYRQPKCSHVHDYAYCQRCSLLTADSLSKVVPVRTVRPRYYVPSRAVTVHPVIRVSSPLSNVLDNQVEDMSLSDTAAAWTTHRPAVVELTVPSVSRTQSVTTLVATRSRSPSPIVRYSPNFAERVEVDDVCHSSPSVRSRSCSPRPPVVKHLCSTGACAKKNYLYVDAEDCGSDHDSGLAVVHAHHT